MWGWIKKFFMKKKIEEIKPFEFKESFMSEETVILKDYKSFRDAVGVRESSNNYRAKNRYGYLGRYQFGLARLSDMGLCQRKPGTKGWGNKSFVWTPPFSETIFLNNPRLQDAIFDEHVRLHRDSILRDYPEYLDIRIQGVKITISGAVACYHLLGRGGFINFIEGSNPKDAMGTTAGEYITLFAGYSILPTEVFTIADLKKIIRKSGVA